MLTKLFRRNQPTGSTRRRASVVIEYILLLTIVGIGAIVGLATVRNALVHELVDLADAIEALNGDNGDNEEDPDDD